MPRNRTTFVIGFMLLALPLFRMVEASDSESLTLYHRAVELFYKARYLQSEGKPIISLQRYEEAYSLFRQISNKKTDAMCWKAERKMKVILREVNKIEIQQGEEGDSLQSSVSSQGVLSHFGSRGRQDAASQKETHP